MARENTIPILHDVIIIGGGPAGLAIASRIREKRPSALFADDEHERYHWIKKHGRKMNVKSRKTGAETGVACDCIKPGQLSMLVLDATGDQWMQRWNTLFRLFEIHHLRSPMFFHVDPADRDSLLSFCHAAGASKEILELKGCVGKEVTKHQKKKQQSGKRDRREVNINQRDKEDYYTPSQRLFRQHCQAIAKTYNIANGLLKQDAVLDIQYGEQREVSKSGQSLFRVATESGFHYAKTVVLAIGPGNKPAIPAAMVPKDVKLQEYQTHSMQIKDFPAQNVAAKLANRQVTNVLVVGGGLTSAQLSDMAIRRGVTNLWHLMRGTCKVKHFDVDLKWMGKYRNLEQAAFWSADTDEERFEMIKNARGGGSITPLYYKILQKHVAAGKLSLHPQTVIASKTFDYTSKQWRIETKPALPDLPLFDHIYFATGIQTDFNMIPMLQSMIRDYPVKSVGGLPCLTDDLMWAKNVPLFVTGRLAGLRLGPAAGNLGGARIGAERIAWSIGDYLDDDEGSAGAGLVGKEDEQQERLDYATGRGNRYTRLEVE